MEKELFAPIKKYFETLGYVCDGEVNDIDLYMRKEVMTDEEDGKPAKKVELSAAVELKQTLDFKSIQQAAVRQKIVDDVYIGIFKPRDLYSKSYRDKIYLLKRLGIGLIVVGKRIKTVDIVTEPVVTELKKFKSQSKRKKEALEKEFGHRRVKSNTGGVTGTKIMTAYREDALLVLDALAELGGEGSPKEVREISGVEKAYGVLRGNPYGWFENVSKGKYSIRDKGYDALEEFEDALKILKGYHG